jgi:hypothetical protein
LKDQPAEVIKRVESQMFSQNEETKQLYLTASRMLNYKPNIQLLNALFFDSNQKHNNKQNAANQTTQNSSSPPHPLVLPTHFPSNSYTYAIFSQQSTFQQQRNSQNQTDHLKRQAQANMINDSLHATTIQSLLETKNQYSTVRFWLAGLTFLVVGMVTTIGMVLYKVGGDSDEQPGEKKGLNSLGLFIFVF